MAVMTNDFICDKENIIYESVKNNYEKIIRLNGNNKWALKLEYEQLEESRRELQSLIEEKVLNILVREKVLAQIQDEMEKDGRI